MYHRSLTQKLLSHLKFHTKTNSKFELTTKANPSPINPSHLLRVSTVLYQQQNSTDSKLLSHLQTCDFDLTHEFFIQICNKFLYSWRPIYKFFRYTQTQSKFSHTSTTYNKILDIFGKSKNIELLWKFLQEMVREQNHLVNDKTFVVAIKSLAGARELQKCVQTFHLMNTHELFYSLEIMNKVVETLCSCKLVDEARFIVSKLRPWIKPCGATYKFLIVGLCRVGDLVEASKVWNLMVDDGFEPDVDSCDVMIETLFKNNKFDEAMKVFESMRVEEKIHEMGPSTYRLVITWMCKKGRIVHAHVVFNEMLKRGISIDNQTLAALVYGLMSKGRVREAYKVVEGIEDPDISVYHELIKGLLRLRRASEATQVFRIMVKRGCEPIMHTYIMLLQGHLGKRGRKGPNPIVNFDSIFVGGLVKVGKSLEATKYIERMMGGSVEVPRFDYNRFLYSFSNEEGVLVFEEIGKRLREVGLVDLADILVRYGEKMTTRDRRRRIIDCE